MDVEYCSGTLVAIPCQGHTIDALLYHPEAPAAQRGNTPVVLRLHGLLGNLLDETEHFLPYRLAQAGHPSLTMNTLLANLGLFFGFGVLTNTMVQIDTACEFLKQQGYQRIVIAGHGL